MKKYLVMYHAPAELMQQTMSVPPEQQAKGMQMWMDWMKRVGPALIDGGSPLMGGQKITMEGKPVSRDKEVSGYTILQAENIDKAKALLNGHPHLGWNPKAYIEIHEFMAMPGM